MPQIIYTQRITEDFQRLQGFLNKTAPHKTAEAMQAIFDKIDMLLTLPKIGRAAPMTYFPIYGNCQSSGTNMRYYVCSSCIKK